MLARKNILTFFMLGILFVAFVPLITQQVFALSAVSTSNGSTFTSLATQWDTVWVNPAGTITYFIDTSGNDVKVVKMNNTDGSTISTNTYTPGTGSGSGAISEVFTLSSANYIIYYQQNSATPAQILVDRLNIDSGAFTSATATPSCTTASNAITVYVTKNKVYYVMHNNSNASLCTSKSNLDLTSFANIGNALENSINSGKTSCTVTTDGSTETTDVAYCLIARNIAGGTVWAKFVNGVYTNKGVLASGGSATTEIFKVGDKVIGRNDVSGTETTAYLTPSTDTVGGTIFTTNWINYNVQSTLLTDTTRAATPADLFLATSSEAIGFDKTSGEYAPVRMPALTVDSGAPSITWFTDSFFKLSDTVYATHVTTTTTPKILGSGVAIAPTLYSENLNVPLDEDYEPFQDDVIQVACDALYTMHSAEIFVGSDADCSQWVVLDDSANVIGRELPYNATGELVHYIDYTMYSIHVTLAVGDASDFYAVLSYDDVDVDQNNFDATDNAQLRMLYGQCYTLEYRDTLTNEIESSSSVCADDVTFKEDVIGATLGFTFWSAPWGGEHTFNEDTNVVTTLVHHQPDIYNYTVTFYNSSGTEILTEDITGASNLDVQTYNLTAYADQAPIKVKYFTETGRIFYNQWVILGGDWFAPITDAINGGLGDFEGFGLLMFLPILFAAIFTRNTAGIGGGMIVAFIGVLVTFGLIPLAAPIIALMAFAAIMGILAYRILNQ